jgi:tetratricopeptide (TPR) repeat protein
MMMALVDCRGVPVSTNDVRLVELYEQALDLSAGYYMDSVTVLQRALDEDPEFAAAHCLRAGLMLTSTDKRALPMLRESVEAIEALGRRANERERAHAAAARAWLQGDFAGSVRRYGDILIDYPRDLLALQITHLGDFFLGASSMLRDRIAQVIPMWDPSVPGYNYVLGMYAFGLEENGAYARAEDTGRRALELNPRDPWAVHAVAHVMEMQGRVREGINWLTSRQRDWAPNNGFAFHNWWHLALYHWDLGDIPQVLSLYDTQIRPTDSQAPLEMIDASALLWRLHIRGVDVGDRWRALAWSWEDSAEDGYYAFNDVHAMMSFAAADRGELVSKTFATMEACAQGHDTNAMMTREIGLPAARAIHAFVEGRYGEAVEQLLPIRTIANRFGGSNAQRDLLHLTLVEAAVRGGKLKLARALVAERTLLKASSQFNQQLRARVYDSLGDVTGGALNSNAAKSHLRAQGARRI